VRVTDPKQIDAVLASPQQVAGDAHMVTFQHVYPSEAPPVVLPTPRPPFVDAETSGCDAIKRPSSLVVSQLD
jgi:hypothetical protein